MKKQACCPLPFFAVEDQVLNTQSTVQRFYVSAGSGLGCEVASHGKATTLALD